MGRKNSKKKQHKERHGSASASGKVLKGVLDVTRSGMGFVTIEGMEVDVIVRPNDFNTALHGDTVRVGIKDMKSNSRRMQGVVKEVLNRKRTEFVGQLQMNKGFAFFVAVKSRGIKLREYPEFLGILWRYLRKRPLDFIMPTKKTG